MRMDLRRLVIILTFLIPSILLAQDEVVSLMERMQLARGSEKADLLNEISIAYRKSDRFMSMNYARQAYNLSTGINYLPGKAFAKKNEGISWFFIGSNDSASICYHEALEIYTIIKDKKGMSACYNNLGLIAQETGKYDEAVELYQLSIEIDKELGDEMGAITTKRNLVDIYIYKGDSKKALGLSNEVLFESRNISDNEGVMRALINRSAIYDNLMMFDASIQDQKEAIVLAKKLKDTYAEAMALSNLGLVVWHKGNPDEALQILNLVLGMTSDIIDGYEILNTLWIMSEIYTSKKQYATSNEKLLELLKRYEAMDNKRQEAKVLTSLGRNLVELNEIDKALGYLNKSLEITVEIDASFEKLENYRNLAHVKAILHDFKAADSLQDLFAQNYSYLFKVDSIDEQKVVIDNRGQSYTNSKANTANWLSAFILFFIAVILSVIAYRK